MKEMQRGKRFFWAGMLLIILFVLWTVLVQTVDVQNAGETGSRIGFATLNCWFHKITGVHMWLYSLTDWLGLVPVFICLLFGSIGFIQMIKRKSLLKVDLDLIFLGIYYVLVIVGYLVFEKIPVNYRPVLIEGRMEASYPSSTTLLVLSVMPTLVFGMERRLKNANVKTMIHIVTLLFSVFMILGRLLSGVHWFSDIVGSVLLSVGLFYIYQAIVLLCEQVKS